MDEWNDAQVIRRIAEAQAAMRATPHKQLIEALLNPSVPKTEREHAAAREIEQLRADLAKVNNEFGCETADWPDAWRRVAAVKQEAGKCFRDSEELRAENERLKEQLKTCATILTEELIRGRLIGVPQKLRFAAERGMKNLDEVNEWMITTRRNFEAMSRKFAAMNARTGDQA